MKQPLLPGFQGRYATNISEAAFPQLWKNLIGLWNPGVGRQGMRLRDFSGNRHHGVLTNMTDSDWTFGPHGHALDYDGSNDFTTCGDIPLMNGASRLTLTAWFKQAVPGNGRTAVAKFSDNSNRVLLGHDGATLFFILANGGNTFGSIATTSVVWTHHAMVFDGTQTGNSARLKGYINGALQTLAYTGTIPATAPSIAAAPFDIGRQGAAFFATARIGEVCLYNRPLSQREVSLLSNGISPLKKR